MRFVGECCGRERFWRRRKTAGRGGGAKKSLPSIGRPRRLRRAKVESGPLGSQSRGPICHCHRGRPGGRAAPGAGRWAIGVRGGGGGGAKSKRPPPISLSRGGSLRSAPPACSHGARPAGRAPRHRSGRTPKRSIERSPARDLHKHTYQSGREEARATWLARAPRRPAEELLSIIVLSCFGGGSVCGVIANLRARYEALWWCGLGVRDEGASVLTWNRGGGREGRGGRGGGRRTSATANTKRRTGRVPLAAVTETQTKRTPHHQPRPLNNHMTSSLLA